MVIIYFFRHLRKWFLIIDNFVPSEERSRLINLAHYDEDIDNWLLRKEKIRVDLTERPLAHNYRRPISDNAVRLSQNSSKYRVMKTFFIITHN